MGEEPPGPFAFGHNPSLFGHHPRIKEWWTEHTSPTNSFSAYIPAMHLHWARAAVLVALSSSLLGSAVVPRQDQPPRCNYDTCPDLTPEYTSSDPNQLDGVLSCAYSGLDQRFSCVYNATSVSIFPAFRLYFSPQFKFRVISR